MLRSFLLLVNISSRERRSVCVKGMSERRATSSNIDSTLHPLSSSGCYRPCRDKLSTLWGYLWMLHRFRPPSQKCDVYTRQAIRGSQSREWQRSENVAMMTIKRQILSCVALLPRRCADKSSTKMRTGAIFLNPSNGSPSWSSIDFLLGGIRGFHWCRRGTENVCRAHLSSRQYAFVKFYMASVVAPAFWEFIQIS